MKVTCSRKNECSDVSCSHYHSHETLDSCIGTCTDFQDFNGNFFEAGPCIPSVEYVDFITIDEMEI